METLNNINTIISIMVGIFGIAGSLFGIVSYLRNKASSSQRKQTAQLQATQPQSSPQIIAKPLSKLDWMEVLWNGLEDCIKARGGEGWINIVGGGVFIAIVIFFASLMISQTTTNSNLVAISMTVFGVIFLALLILFYVYFVGRRIEKKFEEMNKPLKKKSQGV